MPHRGVAFGGAPVGVDAGPKYGPGVRHGVLEAVPADQVFKVAVIVLDDQAGLHAPREFRHGAGDRASGTVFKVELPTSRFAQCFADVSQ